MIIGFTGTQDGMTSEQHIAVIDIVRQVSPNGVHHGDCVGADEEFHRIAQSLRVPIVIHPPDNPVKRAWCEGGLVKDRKPYLERNHDIVDSVDLLIAAPRTSEEQLRSGTWSTVRYARKIGKSIVIITPNGTVTRE